MKELKVYGDKIVLLDDDDYERLYTFTWCIAYMKSGFYAVRAVNRKTRYMHHDVLGKPPSGMVTDHINRNSLDNTKENLRHVTYRENYFNADRPEPKYISVEYGRFRARPTNKDGQKIHLGSFDTYEEAEEVVGNWLHAQK